MTYEQNRVRQPVSLNKKKDADIITYIKVHVCNYSHVANQHVGNYI